MKRANPEDKNLIIDLLTKSFDSNLSVNYIVKQDNSRIKCIQALMEYSIDVCWMFGDVFLSDDNKSCALILYPQQKKTTWKSIWLDAKLIASAIGVGGIIKTMKRESLIKNLQPKQPMAYLWFIGVDTLYQHQGIGSSLLQEIVLKAIDENLPIYLETSTLKNIPWYERFGFEIYNELNLDYTLFFLRNIIV